MEKLSVLIADDHELVRKGLKHFLETNGVHKITEAENGREAYHLIRELNPEIAILDIQMPEMTGVDVASLLAGENHPVRLILLTMFRDEAVFNRALDLGVRGYILKENTVSEILTCIRKVREGGHYISPVLTEFLLARTTRQSSGARQPSGPDLLTASEARVLKLLATMKTNQEIATELGVSIKTVHNHRNNICNKLDLRGAHALLRYAIENADRI